MNIRKDEEMKKMVPKRLIFMKGWSYGIWKNGNITKDVGKDEM